LPFLLGGPKLRSQSFSGNICFVSLITLL
jgi:hypothetical protein